eukprot:GEZU01015795.1.p3 GENE.GEZU01015795.1~~GEZU01015795.1.p3  ORF type:complete len:101 (-),score=11.12 GEZU01015795.1:695-997(-)
MAYCTGLFVMPGPFFSISSSSSSTTSSTTCSIGGVASAAASPTTSASPTATAALFGYYIKPIYFLWSGNHMMHCEFDGLVARVDNDGGTIDDTDADTRLS